MTASDQALRPGRILIAGLLLAMLASLLPLSMAVAVGPGTVTPATGGGTISADDAVTLAWTTLNGPTIDENTAANFGNGSVVLNVPAGFRFNAGVGTVTKSPAGCGLTATALVVTASTATFTLGGSPSAVTTCEFAYSGLQVQPTTGSGVGSGSITRSGTATGLPGGNYGTLTKIAGNPAALVFGSYPAASTPALLTPQPTVNVVDQFGNLITTDTRTIRLSINQNPSTFSCFGQALGTTPSIAAVNGVATFTGCIETTVANGYRLTANDAPASVPDLPLKDGELFNVTSGIASRLAICWGSTSPCTTTPPSPNQGGTAFSTQPRVVVTDSLGNIVPTDNTTLVALSIAPGSPTSGGPGTLTCTANSVAVVAGVGTFAGCKIDKVGTAYRLLASSTPTFTTATSNPFDVVPGLPVKLGFIAQPTTASAGSAITPAIQVAIQDAGGNTVSIGYTASIQLALGTNPVSATLNCGNSNTAVTSAGVATFPSCVIDRQGSGFTIIATATAVSPTVALATAQTNPFNVIAPLAAITLTPSSNVITWGDDVTLQVHFGVNGAGKAFNLQVSKDGVTWSTIAALTTDVSGNASFVYGPSDNRYYRAAFAGTPDLQAGMSAVQRVVVRQIAILRPPPTSGYKPISKGTTILFETTCRPNRPELPQCIAHYVVYQLKSGAWVQVLDRMVPVNRANGVASLQVTFNTAGKFYVRSEAVPTPQNANSGWSPLDKFEVS